MKVLLVMPFSESPYGGVQAVAYNLVEGFVKLQSELERRDIQIIILSNTGATPTLNQEELTSNLRVVYFKLYPPITLLGDVQYAQVIKKIKDLIRLSHIVHSHDILFSIPLSLMENKLLIHNFHGLQWKEKMAVNSPYIRFSYDTMTVRAKILAKRSLTQALTFVAISKYVSEEIQHTLEIPREKVRIVYDPIPMDVFKLKKREDYGLIYYPARLVPRKNHLPLIKALGLLKKDGQDFKLVLTGTAEDIAYFKSIKSLIDKYNLKENVIFAGKIPREKVLEYHSRASIVVLTSLEESFSLVALEGMASGTPVVASPVGVIPEVIKSGKNGYIINPTDPKDISEKLRLLLDDKKLRVKFGKNAKKTSEQFRSDRIASGLIDLWREIVNEKDS